MPTRAQTQKQKAAIRLGMDVTEIVDVAETPAGVAIHVFDGSVLIDVPAEHPDFAGKSGLMFLVPPSDDYAGDFPVFAQEPADEEDDES